MAIKYSPRVTELFEARTPKGFAPIAEATGRVKIDDSKRTRTVVITPDDGSEEIEKHKTSAARIGRQAYQNSGITSDLAMLLQMAEGTSADGGIGRVDWIVRP